MNAVVKYPGSKWAIAHWIIRAYGRSNMKQTRFEVRRDGRVMACTEHKECIPPRERRDELRRAGYRLYLDGKIWKEGRG